MAGKSVSVDRYRLVGTYDRLRRSLLDAPDDGRLDQTLSYWVLPTDRRLPLAFLDRTLRDLLAEPFDKLIATHGVGHKKILGFFELLQRAIKPQLAERRFGFDRARKPARAAAVRGVFDPAVVSEQLWQSWCESIRRGGFVDRKLGELAPSLLRLPTVIWHTPLSAYVDESLAEIRNRKTHGEKRLHAILEVFCTVHEATATSIPAEHMAVDLAPEFIASATRWITLALSQDRPLSASDVRRHLALPILTQIDIDLGSDVARLVRERLELDGAAPTVKQQAARLGVTRARVYQLLEDCGSVMAVRWPQGRWLLAPLWNKSQHLGSDASAKLIGGLQELMFPEDDVIEEPFKLS